MCAEVVCNFSSLGVGQNHTPIGDHDDDAGAFSVSDVPVAEVFNGTDWVNMLDLDHQGTYFVRHPDTHKIMIVIRLHKGRYPRKQ